MKIGQKILFGKELPWLWVLILNAFLEIDLTYELGFIKGAF